MIVKDYLTQMEENTAFQSSVSTDKTKMLGVANQVLKKFFRKLDLKPEQIEFPTPITTVDGTYIYYIDSRCRTITNMRTSTNHYLSFMSREEFERKYPYDNTPEGEPEIYVPLEKVRVQAQPTSASTISIVSSSGSDITSYLVEVVGLVSGVLTKESVTLTGATAAVTTNTYNSLISITKNTTNGTVTATSNSGAVTNIALQAVEKDREFWKIRLYKTPDTVYTIYYTGHTNPFLLSADEDVIQIPDLWTDIFINECTKTLLWKQGDKRWQEYANIVGKEFDNLDDNNFASEDSDSTFGFPELDYTYNQGR